MHNADIAIVIPAYKDIFFNETLESLAGQTDKGFKVYIGDDCSPYDLQSIVQRFSDRLNIEYVRFSENIGRKDLVSHWNRCLKLTGNEAFVCMFSDDDIMMPDCIKDFRKTVSDFPDYDVYHWDIEIIDANSEIHKVPPRWQESMSSEDFFSNLYRKKIDAKMPEFIFRKDILMKKGFIPFDLAFRTDNATVMVLAAEKGIRTITSDSKILWRNSGINISKNVSRECVARKAAATIDFFNWTESFFSGRKYPLPRYKYVNLMLKNIADLHIDSGLTPKLDKYIYFRSSSFCQRTIHHLYYMLYIYILCIRWNRERLIRHRIKKLQLQPAR